ncbi:MAG: TonB-dependent receptor, partial [Deltaproteobacteria bacterium]
MKSKGARAFSAAALFLSVLSVVRLFAQGTNQVHEAKSASEHQLSEIVVSASRFEEEAWKSGSSISVVPDQQIRISRQTQTAETLRGEPGAVVNNNTGVPGGVSQISIRGLPFSRTLVDVDGLRLNRPIDNIANLTDLPPLALGNVELLRGPQSSLYGSEAEGGVVTVSTPRGKGAPSFGTSFEGGTFDTRRERLFSQGTESGFDWNVEYARLDTANQRPNNALRQDAAVVHLGYDISSSARVDWNSRWTDYTAGASDSVLGFGANDPDNRLMRRMLLLSPSLTLTPVEIWETRLTLGFIGVGQRSDQPPNTGFGTEFVNHSESQQLQWQNTIYATDWNTLVAGIEARREHTTTSFDSGNNGFNRATQAAYLSDSFRWEDWWGMTLSGRFDDNEGCRDVWTYRASQFFQLPETKSRLHMSFGTAFRSPTISELKPLFGPGSGENPNLVPETTEGYDAGMTQPLLDGKLELDSTYFYNSVVNLIETDSNFVFQNVSKMRTEGV